MEEEESFKVRDKRRLKEGVGEGKAEEAREESRVEKQQAEMEEQPHSIPVEINFASFIFSLGRSAFIHLGEEPDPVTGGKKISLPLAKETIDIISMLEEKTKGNLTPEEEHLTKNILYALRMRYVELASKEPNR